MVERNLVVVAVVVRDAKGAAVGGLRKEDFRLLDNGRPQAITGFSVEASKPQAGRLTLLRPRRCRLMQLRPLPPPRLQRRTLTSDTACSQRRPALFLRSAVLLHPPWCPLARLRIAKSEETVIHLARIVRGRGSEGAPRREAYEVPP